MNKIFGMLGLAQKAGCVSSGTVAVKNSFLQKKVFLLIMSNDIAENTCEELIISCKKQNIPWIVMGSKYQLGNAIGKSHRVMVTVNDEQIAGAIIAAAGQIGKEATGVVEWPK